MRQSNTGLFMAVIISLVCHTIIFGNVGLIFGDKIARNTFKLTKIFFLGPILQESDYNTETDSRPGDYVSKLNTRIMIGPVKARPEQLDDFGRSAEVINKPVVFASANSKTAYFKPAGAFESRKPGSSIMFYPNMPYHFMLYFKDRQTAHMEVTFYVSDQGRITGLKRRVSSGNPEVDLLIMRNLTYFLNLCKSNLSSNSWETVKIDLSP